MNKLSGTLLYCSNNQWKAYAEAKCVGYQNPPHEGFWEGTTTDPVAAYTLLLAVLTAALVGTGIAQWIMIGRQVRLARDEFNATHRPRLSVRNIDVKSAGIDVLVWGDIRSPAPNEIFSGQFYISNKGDANARITDAYLCFWTSREGLPMSRPYEGENGNLGVTTIWIEPGASVPILFSTQLIASDIKDDTFVDARQQTIFAMGWVEYMDQAGRSRRSAFCRPYVSSKRRFMHGEENDPDYEHEE
jgi:hypothetical protein